MVLWAGTVLTPSPSLSVSSVRFKDYGPPSYLPRQRRRFNSSFSFKKPLPLAHLTAPPPVLLCVCLLRPTRPSRSTCKILITSSCVAAPSWYRLRIIKHLGRISSTTPSTQIHASSHLIPTRMRCPVLLPRFLCLFLYGVYVTPR